MLVCAHDLRGARRFHTIHSRPKPLNGVHLMVIEAVGSLLRRPQLLWLCSTLYIAPDKLESVKPFHPIRSKLIKTEYKSFPPFPVFGQVFYVNTPLDYYW